MPVLTSQVHSGRHLSCWLLQNWKQRETGQKLISTKMTVQSQSCWKIVLIRPKSYHYLLTHTLLDIPEKCNAIQDNSLFIYLRLQSELGVNLISLGWLTTVKKEAVKVFHLWIISHWGLTWNCLEMSIQPFSKWQGDDDVFAQWNSIKSHLNAQKMSAFIGVPAQVDLIRSRVFYYALAKTLE